MNETDLALQAPVSAHSWLTAAIRRIDEELGEGYAKAHPELVAAFMRTCAVDYAVGSLGNRFTDGVLAICGALRE